MHYENDTSYELSADEIAGRYANDTSYELSEEDGEYETLMDGSVFGLGRWPECGRRKKED